MLKTIFENGLITEKSCFASRYLGLSGLYPYFGFVSYAVLNEAQTSTCLPVVLQTMAREPQLKNRWFMPVSRNLLKVYMSGSDQNRIIAWIRPKSYNCLDQTKIVYIPGSDKNRICAWIRLKSYICLDQTKIVYMLGADQIV